MFTGIIETMGTIRQVLDRPGGAGRTLSIVAPPVIDGLKIGDSIAVNGTCLTVTSIGPDQFDAEAVPETLRLTNIGDLSTGHFVNLERPMRADGRFDGHIVQGHIDGIGEVESVVPEGEGKRLRVRFPEALDRYIVHKGSVTVDGISLTVADIDSGWFDVAVIPHTIEVTVLGQRQAGDKVNLEVDVIAKYVERMLEHSS